MRSDAGSSMEEYRRAAQRWLEANATARVEPSQRWGHGSDSMALFPALSDEDERAMLDRALEWQRRKSDAGYGSITWAPEDGGAGLTAGHERIYREEEARYNVPPVHDALTITLNLIAPTIRAHGTPEQRVRFVPPMRRGDVVWCQLFSEPEAGSDLASVRARAQLDGDAWVIDGQKVWTSGAQFADWGYIVCRTDPDVVKHRGLTTFIVPMRAPGIEVRRLRQMSGGSSFNEVYFDGVRVPDHLRLGAPGDGWKVVLTTLGFERGASSGGSGDSRFRRLRALAEHLCRTEDPLVRQALAEAYSRQKMLAWTASRAAARRRAGATPGPEGSIGKMAWTRSLDHLSHVASMLLGPRLVADTGEWGTFAWSQHVLGAPGYHVAGGTDEVQRTIVAERALGLPPEARHDKDVPFSALPR